MEARVDGKIVLVTGSTQGIGRAIAVECAKSGAEAIVVSGLDTGAGEQTVSELTDLGSEAYLVVEDLTIEGGADRVFDQASSRFGRIDALVNCAGLTTRGSTLDATRKLWDELFQINAKEPFFLMQRMIGTLRRQKRPGEILNILSMNAHGGGGELTVYSATKAALSLITKNAAHQHRFDRIRINGINVGWTDTPAERTMQAELLGKGPGWLDEAAAQQPFKRLLSPKDVASLSVFLLSDVSSPMTGSIVDQEQWVLGGVDS
ncbi:SDR family oxidoreductase [Hoeflea prorocentri]|uniref:SDR family oxidoreductase n=1 Tax=Hoeflea prorocentri TaxID=1922333 RepID=A0A9X3ZIA1_9HYPH|nr:SDR family oxidoreductase [Hoeflea prorocentri]MCY6381793.1 SDR family oxidoreductase [Hoeflea prorocentri]MDA5399593.1 SDR family oxidoreductase [Hoeflea prorocentri]